MKIFQLALYAVIIISCATSQNKPHKETRILDVPNGYRLTDKLFIDKSEISIIAWLEYQYYINRKYGELSEEFQETIPDTAILKELYPDSQVSHLMKRGQNNFDGFPMVGVTQEQSKRYSDWRSNVVMEAFLIMNDIIKPNPNPNPDNIFTIQKYFNGEYLHYTPEPRIQTYVRFDLPTTEDMLYVDSLFSHKEEEFFNSCKTQYCADCKRSSTRFVCNEMNNIVLDIYNTYVRPIHKDCGEDSFLEVHNLHGNVAEWLHEPYMIFGGSWQSDFNNLGKIERSNTDKSITIGFRNICEIIDIQELLY